MPLIYVFKFYRPFSIFSSGSLSLDPSLLLSLKLFFLVGFLLSNFYLPLKFNLKILSLCQEPFYISKLITFLLLSKDRTFCEILLTGATQFCILRSYMIFSLLVMIGSQYSSSSSLQSSQSLGNLQYRLCSERRYRILIYIIVFIFILSNLFIYSSVRLQFLINFISLLWRTTLSFTIQEYLRLSIPINYKVRIKYLFSRDSTVHTIIYLKQL